MEEVWFRKHLKYWVPSPTRYTAAALALAKCSHPGFFIRDFERFSWKHVSERSAKIDRAHICRVQQEQVESPLSHHSPASSITRRGGWLKVKKKCCQWKGAVTWHEEVWSHNEEGWTSKCVDRSWCQLREVLLGNKGIPLCLWERRLQKTSKK